MRTSSRLNFVLTCAIALLISSCRQGSKPLTLTEAVRQADKVVLYEGLPHQVYESDVLEEERRTKPVQELAGYAFYQEPLTLTDSDAQRLSEILGDSATYQTFSGEKKCGGFHPDYAVEWHVGADRYRALLCFGCREVKLFGPGLESRHDLDQAAHKSLKELLQGYQKNRPPIESGA